MIKKLYKIKIWDVDDCNLVQETDRLLNDNEAKNFRVAKQFRGTIEEVTKENPRIKKEILGTSI